jgi:hypothetical protein
MTCDRTRTDFVRIVAIALILMFIGFGSTAAPPVHAAPSDEEACPSSEGCVYTKEQGVAQCTCPNPPPDNDKVSKTEESSQKGSFKSSHETDTSSCVTNPSGPHCK